MLSKLLWHTYMRSRFGGMTRYWRELEAFQRLSPPQARREMAQRLLAQLRYYARLPGAYPEWRKAAAIDDLDRFWAFWPSLPIVRKKDLNERFEANRLKRELAIDGQLSSTGGSTGEPTFFFHDAQTVLVTTATRLYARLKQGWQPGMPLICIWGSERDIGKHRSWRGTVSSYLHNYWLIDGYELNETTLNRFLRRLDRHAPAAVYGFSSMLEFLAREIIARKIRIEPGRIVTAWNGGEMLYPSQSSLFQQACGVPILNLYGGRELSATAYQQAPGAPLTIMRPFIFAEVLTAEGKPASPGEAGRLILTGTMCRGTPFIRYEIEDMAEYGPSDIDESGLHHLTALHGRHAGLLKLPNGKTINCIFWNHLFKEYQEISQFQVVLRRQGGITLLFKGRPFDPDRQKTLSTTLHNFLGPIPFEFNWVDKIPLTRQGKHLQVVQEN